MQLITPICRESCLPHIGREVCCVLHDGRHVFGTLTGVTEAGLEFNGCCSGANILSTKPQKAKKQLEQMQEKGKTSAFGGFGFGNPGLALTWASLALLFLVPFFFI